MPRVTARRRRLAILLAPFACALAAAAGCSGTTDPASRPIIAVGRYAYRFDVAAAPGPGTSHQTGTLTVTRVTATHIDAHIEGPGLQTSDLHDDVPTPPSPVPRSFGFFIYEVPPGGSGTAPTEGVGIHPGIRTRMPVCRAAYVFQLPTEVGPSSAPATCSLIYLGP